MLYFKIGEEKKNGTVRFLIYSSETVISGGEQMDEETALALLQQYENEDRVAELKSLLSSTDYIACKIAEGAATAAEYAAEIAQRQAWREEINRLTPEAENNI